MKTAIVDKEVFAMLKKTRNQIDELIETLAVLGDKNALNALEESKRDVRVGRVRRLKDFLSSR